MPLATIYKLSYKRWLRLLCECARLRKYAATHRRRRRESDRERLFLDRERFLERDLERDLERFRRDLERERLRDRDRERLRDRDPLRLLERPLPRSLSFS